MRETKNFLSRRSFFGDVRTVGAVAAAAALVPSARESLDAVHIEALPQHGGGYQLTEHVRRYYQTTRT